MTRGIQAALLGALFIAAVSTLGDFIWATWIPRHLAPYGLIHGALLFLCIGAFLGSLSGRIGSGGVAGLVIGGLAAASFYVLAPVAGYSAMFLSWFGVWIALGILNQRLDEGSFRLTVALSRGVLAAVLSGVAFYFVSGIWLPFRPQGWDYIAHFGAWTLAYLPGFAALLVRRRNDA